MNFVSYKKITQKKKKKKKNKSVAVTDLFPLANQYPRQAIRPLTDQSGA